MEDEYKQLGHSGEQVDAAVEDINTHKSDTTKHITASERAAWNGNTSSISELQAAVTEKVDKIEGKGLSTNDYTTTEKQKLAGLSNYDDAEVRALIEEKVAKTVYQTDKAAIDAEIAALYSGEVQTNSADCVDNLNATYIDKTNSAFVIRKYGKICFARISLKTVTSALTGSDTIISTELPVELRPDMAVYTQMTTRDVGGWAAATLGVAAITIDTNGNVVLRTGTAKTSAAYVTGYVSWYAPNDAVATRSIPSESLTKGATEMLGAEQDETEIREEER